MMEVIWNSSELRSCAFMVDNFANAPLITCAVGLFFNIYMINYLLQIEDTSNGRLLCQLDPIDYKKLCDIVNKI